MAPAAKERKYGSAGPSTSESISMRNAPTGSTMPDSMPYAKAFGFPTASLRGRDMMAPSGKFCMAIPTDNARAPAMVMVLFWDISPAKATPTAIPSGIL